MASEVYLAPLVGMMNDFFGAALSYRHVQRPEYQLGTKMSGHGPPDDPAAEHIEHDRQIQEPGPGWYVRDIGHPDSVRGIRVELGGLVALT